MFDHASHPPTTDDTPPTPSPGTPGEGGGGGLPSEPDTVDLAPRLANSSFVIQHSSLPAPPRPTLLQRFTASRASTLTSLLLALALHVALLSFGYIYYVTTQSNQPPDLPLPQGFATEPADTAPAHPTVTFIDIPTPSTRDPQVTAPFPNPTPKDLLAPPPTDFTPPTPPTPDLSQGPTEHTTDLASPSSTTIPPRPEHRAAVAARQRPADAPANPTASTASLASTSITPPTAPVSLSNTSPSPQGTPDVPPTPSSRNKVPPYPPDALRRRLAGTVLLELHIAATGRVTDAIIQQSSGHDLLDTSARDTALTWTFTPARLDGRPVPITVLRPINFIPPR